MKVLFSALLLFGFCYGEEHPIELTVCSHFGAGFFAEMNKVMDNILYYSKKDLRKVSVDWSDPFFPYKDKPFENGWELYFEPIEVSDKGYKKTQAIHERVGSCPHELHDQLCIDHWVHYEEHLPYRLEVNQLINQYIKVKPHIAEKVERFFKEEMEGNYCIGAHIRYGADHFCEAPKGTPQLEDYIDEIQRLIGEHSGENIKVYLATDSQYVVKRFKEFFSPDRLLTIQTVRAVDRETPHVLYGKGDFYRAHPKQFHRDKPGYKGGEGILMEALLLSKCAVFVHSTSNVASFVSFFNPYIDSLYLPKSQETWKCRYGK